jgi:hypothetical protein
MSLLLDKTGHFVRIQRNREDGLQINPHNFLLYAHYYYPNPARDMFKGISGVFPAGPAPTPFLVRFAYRPFCINNQSMEKRKDGDFYD